MHAVAIEEQIDRLVTALAEALNTIHELRDDRAAEIASVRSEYVHEIEGLRAKLHACAEKLEKLT